MSAPPEPGPDAAARLDLTRLHGAMRRLLTFFRPALLRPSRGAWRTPTGHAWQPAVALDAVLTAYECTADPAYRNVAAATFARYRGRRSLFNDDDGWYLNAWLRAYDLTGQRACLDEAESLFAGIVAYWDGTCGGGVWWRRDRSYKNAVTNELFLLAAAGLHRRTEGERSAAYLDWACRAWSWFRDSGMINPDGLVNDGLDACVNNGGPTWTYNQGVILAGLVELWRATGEADLLDRARGIADAATRTLVHPDGVLREPDEPGNRDAYAFKGIFARGLGRLAALDATGLDPAPYRSFLVANADALATRAGDGRHGYGPSWAGPSGPVNAATQASACLLLGEVALGFHDRRN